MVGEDIFTADFKTDPLWWDDVPRPRPPAPPLPSRVDVVVVGSGYAGLNCALVVTRAGRSTLVLEAAEPGYGASTRLAGFIGRFLHYSFGKLTKRFGLQRAVRMFKESGDAHWLLLELIEREQMEVGKLYRGRFTAAHSPQAYEALARNAEEINRHVPFDFAMCPRSEQHREIGTDYYHGGMILHEHGTLQPAKYHQGLLDAVARAGVGIAAMTPVTRITRQADGFAVLTERGTVQARDVVIATNGYANTQPTTPWIRRRIIPIPAYQIATEPLSAALMKQIKPGGRAVIDSKVNIYWDRPSPDDARLIFGARTGDKADDLRVMARRLRELMVEVYPQLSETRLSHVWQGMMGFSFDRLPHIGRTRDGVYYATGFCGSGLPLGTYFGQKIGHRVLDDSQAETAFWNLGFPTWPFYNGNPWFLRPVMAWHDRSDRRGRPGIARAG